MPQIRWIERGDLDGVHAISQLEFDFPLSKSDFAAFLNKKNTNGFVATEEDRILGYLIYEIRKDCYSVYEMCVLPPYRRRGIGMDLLGKMKEKLSCEGGRPIVADARESTTDAHHFLAAAGFRATGIHRDFFQDEFLEFSGVATHKEDSYRFRYDAPQEILA